MSNTLEILKGSRPVKLSDGREVEVRELAWLPLKEFLGELADQAGKLTTPDGKLVLSIEVLIQAVQQSQSLSEKLLVATVRLREEGTISCVITTEELNALSLSDYLGLLDVSLDLNISTLGTMAKKIGARLRGLAGGPMPAPDGAPVPTPKPALAPSSIS